MNAQLQPDPIPHSEAPQTASPSLEVLPRPPIQQSTNPSIQSAQPRARNGKIARLPKLARDLVNSMLQNNLPYSKIVGALEEHGIRVNERNVSNWKTRGGYKEWAAEQNQAVSIRLHQDNLTEYLRNHDAGELPEIGLQLAATQLSEFFLNPQARQQLAADPQSYARTVGSLCRLARQIHAMQKYRDDCAKALGRSPARIKGEIEQAIETTRDVYSSYIPPTAPKDPEIRHRNYVPKNWATQPDPPD